MNPPPDLPDFDPYDNSYLSDEHVKRKIYPDKPKRTGWIVCGLIAVAMIAGAVIGIMN